MKLTALIIALAVALSGLAIGSAGAAVPQASGAAALRQFEGTVVSVNRDAGRFRLRDAERGTATIKVTSRTRFERIAGLSGLRAGMRRVEATVRRSDGRWVAIEVERSGGGGEHGGDNNHDD
jgi:hypothetical protein